MSGWFRVGVVLLASAALAVITRASAAEFAVLYLLLFLVLGRRAANNSEDLRARLEKAETLLRGAPVSDPRWISARDYFLRKTTT